MSFSPTQNNASPDKLKSNNTTPAYATNFTNTFICTLCNITGITDTDFHIMDEHFEFFENDSEENFKLFTVTVSNNTDSLNISKGSMSTTSISHDNKCPSRNVNNDSNNTKDLANGPETFSPCNTINNFPSSMPCVDSISIFTAPTSKIEAPNASLFQCPAPKCKDTRFSELDLPGHFNMHFRSYYHKISLMKIWSKSIIYTDKTIPVPSQHNGLFSCAICCDNSLNELDLFIHFNNHFKNDKNKIAFMKSLINKVKSTKCPQTYTGESYIGNKEQIVLASAQIHNPAVFMKPDLTNSKDMLTSLINATLGEPSLFKENNVAILDNKFHDTESHTSLSDDSELTNKDLDMDSINKGSECQKPGIKEFSNSGMYSTIWVDNTKFPKYKCNKCDLLLSHKCNIYRHIKSKTCINTYSSSLHENQLYKSSNYKCNYCNKYFSKQFNLERHIKQKICTK